jgi:dTMP kinase
VKRGAYIVLEGPDTTDKATQLRLLAERLQRLGVAVHIFRDDPALEPMTLRASIEQPSTALDVLLYNASRLPSPQAIQSYRNHDVVCLIDHTYLTTMTSAYYGCGVTPNYQITDRIVALASNHTSPDVCIILDVPVQTQLTHLKKLLPPDKYALLDPTSLERVRAGYLWEARRHNWPVVFMADNVDTVTQAIWQIVKKHISLPTQMGIASEPIKAEKIILTAGNNALVDISDLFRQVLNSNRTQPRTDRPAILEKPFSFYVPLGLSDDTTVKYRNVMKEIDQHYQIIIERLNSYLQSIGSTQEASHKQATAIAAGVLPLAATSPIIATTLSAAILQFTTPSQYVTQPEANLISETLGANRLTAPIIVKKSAVMMFAEVHLAHNNVTEAKPITLVAVWPRSELELVPYLLYPYSDQPLKSLQERAEHLSYKQKTTLLQDTFIAAHHSIADVVSYTWDIISDVQILHEFTALHTGRNLSWQSYSPRMGYETPSIIDDANLNDPYETCFDLSLQLFSKLQQSARPEDAQYAVLRGHLVRWKVTCTLSDIKKLSRTLGLRSNSDELRSFVRSVITDILSIHPHVILNELKASEKAA